MNNTHSWRSIIFCSSIAVLFGLATEVSAYNFSNGSYSSENFKVGSCTFEAHYWVDDFGDGMVSGEVELQSNLPGLSYRYIGPKFNMRTDYDPFICADLGLMCDQTVYWETQNTSQLTEANIESSCGISIDDGSFQAINSYSGSTQTYSSTSTQSIAFETNTGSYFLQISAAQGITKTIILKPAAPTGLTATAGDASVSISFAAPSSSGSSSITNYQYELNGSGNWVALSPADTSSPVTITGLTNGVTYSIKLRAINNTVVGVESSAVTVTPVGISTAPTSLVATAGDGQVSVAFTAPTDNGGSAITDYDYQLDGGSWVSAGTTSSPIVITGLTNGTSYSIKLRAVNAAGNGAESAAVSVSLGSPQSVFTQNEDVIRQQVQSVALQSIRNGVQEASSFMSSARDRFIGGSDIDGSQSVFSGRNSIPMDVDGFASVSTSSANIDGSFFGQFGNFDGTYRRMTSGDFNLQRDENGNTTGALSGRIAWEYLTSDTAMLGWFVGAEYIQSDMTGTFTGDQTSFGASIGGYFVTELQDQMYLDGHLTVKQNEHDLQLTNGTLELDSLYHSTSVLSGLTLTGVSAIDESSEIWPTFSINTARTDLGTIGFIGTAYGLTDSTLSMDGGLVSYADVSVAPKYRAAMDGQSLANSLLVATVTPKVMCEYTELDSTMNRPGFSGGSKSRKDWSHGKRQQSEPLFT